MLRKLLKTPEKVKTGGDGATSEEAPSSSAALAAAAAPVPRPAALTALAKDDSSSDSEESADEIEMARQSDCEFVLFKGDQLRKVVQYRSSVRFVRGRNKRARRFISPPRTRRTDSKRSLPLSHAFLCVVRLPRRVASAFVFVIFWTAKRTPFKT